MDKSTLATLAFSVLLTVGVVTYRLLWLGSSAAAASGLARIKLPRFLCRRLLDECPAPARKA
jgi:hypothetical protein